MAMTRWEYKHWRTCMSVTEDDLILSVGEQVDDLSSKECFCCGTRLAGERHQLFWKDQQTIPSDPFHEDVCCIDCLLYLANGEEPEHGG